MPSEQMIKLDAFFKEECAYRKEEMKEVPKVKSFDAFNVFMYSSFGMIFVVALLAFWFR